MATMRAEVEMRKTRVHTGFHEDAERKRRLRHSERAHSRPNNPETWARRRRSRDRNGSREGHGRHARERIESRICSRINSRSESLRGEGQRLGATGDNDHVRMQDGFSLEKFAYG